ncbi:MAG TPA: IS110 family transposase [Acidimicrobiales bacterium]
MTIVEATRTVVGGIDTHSRVHVAAVLDEVGGLLGSEAFAADPPGYAAALSWFESFGRLRKVGVEGTGSYGAGLCRFLMGAGIEVVEVDRQNRQARRNAGKSDPLDAVEAARAALSGKAAGAAKSRNGWVEALRVLLVAKRSARSARVKALTQMRALTYSAPDELRTKLEGLSISAFVSTCRSLRASRTHDRVLAATKASLSSLAHRVGDLEAEIDELDATITPLVRSNAAHLLAIKGVGIDTATSLLVAAGDNPERLRSEAAWAHLCGVSPLEASSGKVTRHRLNRGGDRQANCALWHIVITRLASDPDTQAYMERRVKEGRSKREVIRVLKRYVAREVYRDLPRE